MGGEDKDVLSSVMLTWSKSTTAEAGGWGSPGVLRREDTQRYWVFSVFLGV